MVDIDSIGEIPSGIGPPPSLRPPPGMGQPPDDSPNLYFSDSSLREMPPPPSSPPPVDAPITRTPERLNLAKNTSPSSKPIQGYVEEGGLMSPSELKQEMYKPKNATIHMAEVRDILMRGT